MKPKIKKILHHPLLRISLIIAIIIMLLMSCEYGLEHGNENNNQSYNQNTNTDSPNDNKRTNVANDENNNRKNPHTPQESFTEKDLEYKGKRVALTHHARCRMDCREIDAFEIQEVINQDNINQKKSKPASGKKCPALAYEGNTKDGQEVRVIVGDCDDKPIIITVIDLTNDYECSCK